MIFNNELEQILETIDLNTEAPVQEPQRQYYFIKKAKALVKNQEEKLGRKPTCCVNTFGCQMNVEPVTA